jgi:hypothetical protein
MSTTQERREYADLIERRRRIEATRYIDIPQPSRVERAKELGEWAAIGWLGMKIAKAILGK